jgi:putative ABC transport system substrate-binding protein
MLALSAASAESDAPWLAAFRQGMAERGWVEGRDYVIGARYTNGVAQAAPALAAKLAATQPDLLMANTDGSIRLVAQRTKTMGLKFPQSILIRADRVIE